MVELVRELSLALRERVLPHLGSHAGRAHTDSAGAGGDVTFAIDEEAEAMIEPFLAERAPNVAFYSEDRGLVEPSAGCDHVLVIDPIDGTRPAMAGLEACCVSVAAAPLRHDVTMGEVTTACVVEIPTGAVFLAERGKGLLEAPPVRLSRNQDLDRLFWAYGFRGRPARPLVQVVAVLIDRSSVGGAGFDLGSAAFCMTRVLTGQLDAYVEPGPLLVDEVPGMRHEFERVGGGAVLNNSPYDLAGAALCVTEGGGIVTDARGGSLDDRPLLGSGPDFQMSVITSASAPLHAKLVDEVASGMTQLSASVRDG
ncbi:MAG: inositol monophosphatase family protein [Gaiellaceae bacterium]